MFELCKFGKSITINATNMPLDCEQWCDGIKKSWQKVAKKFICLHLTVFYVGKKYKVVTVFWLICKLQNSAHDSNLQFKLLCVSKAFNGLLLILMRMSKHKHLSGVEIWQNFWHGKKKVHLQNIDLKNLLKNRRTLTYFLDKVYKK